MPAWGKVLADQQMANIAEYVFVTFIDTKQAPSKQAPSKKQAVN
jgi:mono/diheme cytochrome c family protein